jgi:FMN phosphatase YigB (HAD superfamily)
MSNALHVIVFDLDGTLASTGNLETSLRRVPHDILKYSPPEFIKSPFLIREELREEMSLAIQCGVKVFVITRAPQAYASTLLQLLGLDFNECLAASTEFDTPESKIRHLHEKYKIPMHRILYIGDMPADEVAAISVGCQFEYPYWLAENELDLESSKSKSLYRKLIDEIMADEGETESEYLIKYRSRIENRYELMNFAAEQKIVLDQSNLLLFCDGQILDLQVFNNPTESRFSFKPAINPNFMTRYEYENNLESYEELTEFIKSIFVLTKLVPGEHNVRRKRFMGTEIRAFTKYMNTLIGEELWQRCKNWKNKDAGSGPEVQLHILELVAVVMSSFLTKEAILIPVPSSKYSVSKPGEISKRLTNRIGQLRGVNYLDILSRDDLGTITATSNPLLANGDYCLVDDQLTDGTTIEKCLDVLPVDTSAVMSIMIWSYSASGHRWVTSNQ